MKSLGRLLILLFGVLGLACWSPGSIWQGELKDCLESEAPRGLIVGKEPGYWVDWLRRSGYQGEIITIAGPGEKLRVLSEHTFDFIIIQTSRMNPQQRLATCSLCWDPLKEGGKMFFEGSTGEVIEGFLAVYGLGVEVLHRNPLIIQRLPGAPEYTEVMGGSS